MKIEADPYVVLSPRLHHGPRRAYSDRLFAGYYLSNVGFLKENRQIRSLGLVLRLSIVCFFRFPSGVDLPGNIFVYTCERGHLMRL